ncbi:MAG: UDP-N-acetylmuramoyl-L-alanine--D-glutamate ligase [Bacillota bacterium]
MDWTGKRVAVVGLGRSNVALARYLYGRGATLVGFDAKTAAELGDRYQILAALPGLEFSLGPGYLERLTGFDTIFVTPGIKKHLPELKRARAEGAVLSSETALFLELCRAPVVGITGSSGKTTTTTLVGQMLAAAGDRPVYVGGNIGQVLIELVEDIPDHAWVVLELSSFQLQLVRSSPHLAALLNLRPNHLDVHCSYDEYVESKCRIFHHQRPGDWLVFNADDPEVVRHSLGSPAGRAGFSRKGPVRPGAFLQDGVLVGAVGAIEEPILQARELLIPGDHNVENALAASTLALLAGARPQTIGQVLSTFAGVEHRLELVRVLDGVRYVNDSIATSPDRTAAALRTVPGGVLLIAGGYDKGLDFDELARVMEGKVRVLVTLGTTAPRIEAAVSRLPAKGRPVVVRARDLAEAVVSARHHGQDGETVLLSPACASFDMFANFEERGQAFKDLVHALH